MNYVIKVLKTKNGAYKILLPKDLTDKCAWSKEDVFLITRFNKNIAIIEPIQDVEDKRYFKFYEELDENYGYHKPLHEAVSFAFYIPKALIIRNAWENLKLLAVHDSGANPIILEAFPNGTKTR